MGDSDKTKTIGLTYILDVMTGVGGAAVTLSAIYIGYRFAKPTEAMLNLKRAKLLYKRKFLSNKPNSIRKSDVDWIKEYMVRKMAPGEKRFPVVIGPRGIGKTTAVETAADGLPGVIVANNVRPGINSDVILDMVLIGINGTLINSTRRALEVIELYKTVSGGQVPTIIIPALQRLTDEKPAELTAAARELTDHFGLNVLIDASENAIPTRALSRREDILHVTPMTDAMMRQLPEFKNLLDYLVKTGNEEVVLAVCNCKPILLGNLNIQINDADEKDKDRIVRYFVETQLRETLDSINKLVIAYPKIGEVSKRTFKKS
jgi:hypothetical protein